MNFRGPRNRWVKRESANIKQPWKNAFSPTIRLHFVLVKMHIWYQEGLDSRLGANQATLPAAAFPVHCLTVTGEALPRDSKKELLNPRPDADKVMKLHLSAALSFCIIIILASLLLQGEADTLPHQEPVYESVNRLPRCLDPRKMASATVNFPKTSCQTLGHQKATRGVPPPHVYFRLQLNVLLLPTTLPILRVTHSCPRISPSPCHESETVWLDETSPSPSEDYKNGPSHTILWVWFPLRASQLSVALITLLTNFLPRTICLTVLSRRTWMIQ